MSTTTVAPSGTLDMQQPGIPMPRLIRMELRKLVNTRAGLWLTLSIVIVSALTTAGMLTFSDTRALALADMVRMMNIPLAIILPVLAILLVTSEWSQRTGLVTFALEPHRPRIVTAKLVTCLIAAACSVVVAFTFGIVGTALAELLDGREGTWEIGLAGVGNSTLGQLLTLLWGFGFGMLVMNSAAAIVLYFALPSIWSVASAIVPWLAEHIQPWADLTVAQTPLQRGTWPSGDEWAQLAVATTIWVVLPLVIGTGRLLRAEVK